jgi:hypothetical protein
MKKALLIVSFYTIITLTIPYLVYKGKFNYLTSDMQWSVFVVSALTGLASCAVFTLLYSQEKEN